MIFFAVSMAGLGIATRQLADSLQQARRRRNGQPASQTDWQVWGLLGVGVAVLLMQAAALIAFGSAGLIFVVAAAAGYAWREVMAAKAFPKVMLAAAIIAVWVLVPELRAPLASLAMVIGILFFLVRGTFPKAKKKS